MMASDQFWSRKQKSDSHDITAWLVSRNKIGIQAQHGIPPLYDLFTPGQQFSYMTPPPTGRRSAPGHQAPVFSLRYGAQSPPHQNLMYLTSSSSPPAAINNAEDDSGFESLVTNVSDSGSASSRLVVTSPSGRERQEAREPAYENVGEVPGGVR